MSGCEGECARVWECLRVRLCMGVRVVECEGEGCVDVGLAECVGTCGWGWRLCCRMLLESTPLLTTLPHCGTPPYPLPPYLPTPGDFDMTLLHAPPNPTAASMATFEFTSCDPSSGWCTLVCTLDGAPLASCTSPLEVGPLTRGEHVFNVTAMTPLGAARMLVWPWAVLETVIEASSGQAGALGRVCVATVPWGLYA